MRPDNHGLFWSDPVGVVRGGPRVQAVRDVPVPDTGWTLPATFPRLEGARALAIDVETRDLGLEAGQGPGWAWEGGGEVVGLSVATDDGEGWYFPVEGRVDGLRREGFPRERLMAWARDELGRAHQPKLGANIQYDIGWLRREGVRVAGEFHDVQFAEPLLDEHAFSYSLATLTEKYGLTAEGEGKGAAETALYAWLAASYGGKADRRGQAGNIYRAPSALVGPYATGDVTLPFDIWRKQYKKLQDEGLVDVYDLERALIPILVEMRWRGWWVDVAGAERRSEWLGERGAELRRGLGAGADPGSAVWLAAAFDRAGVPYPRTEKGNPSFTQEWLNGLAAAGSGSGWELARDIQALRRYEKAKGTFIDGYVLGLHHGGRVHGQFHPLRTDESGTVSGRLSSSDPNLQNIPSRDAEVKGWTRGLFLPEEGEELLSVDYSQLEYRLMVHRAVGKGAEEARQRYREDPSTDYHSMVQDMIQVLTGRRLGRKPIKNVNFGKIFGMGERKLMAMLGLSQEEAHDFFRAYDQGIPFARATLEAAGREAQRDGHILTLAGRRARFSFWEARGRERTKELPEAEARRVYGSGVVRSRTHKALNAYTQGGGGDVIKRAMVACWKEGQVALATVHDELVFSLQGGAEGDRRQAMVVELMQGVAPELSVPLLCTSKRGPNWGEMR